MCFERLAIFFLQILKTFNDTNIEMLVCVLFKIFLKKEVVGRWILFANTIVMKISSERQGDQEEYLFMIIKQRCKVETKSRK